MLFLAEIVTSTSILDVRDAPARVVHTPLRQSDYFPAQDTSFSNDTNIPLPETKVRLPVAWIKEFLAFKSHDMSEMLSDDNKPLTSKFRNLERTMSNDCDLRSWTRYIVNHDRDELDAKSENDSEQSVDLKIDEFIAFLVHHKGFRAQNLQFLHRQDLDYGYEQIEEELTKVFEDEREARRIEVGGEVLGASTSSSSLCTTSFFVTCVAVVAAACVLAI